MTNKSNQLPMCFGPVVACLCDLTVTLAGQSKEYWSGNWSAVTEGNPIPHSTPARVVRRHCVLDRHLLHCHSSAPTAGRENRCFRRDAWPCNRRINMAAPDETVWNSVRRMSAAVSEVL